MSIMDIFKAAINPGVAAPANTAAATGQPPMPNPGTTPSNVAPLPGVDPNNPTNPTPTPAPAPDPNASPLDAFKDLWNTTNTPQDSSLNPLNGFDPAKIREQAMKRDFTKLINPELLAKVNAGGQEGQAAMIAIMAQLAQQAYADSAVASVQAMSKAFEKNASLTQSKMPEWIKKHTVGESMVANNPALNHPAMQPVVTALRDQFVAKYPMATSAEINSHISGMMTAMASAMAPNTNQNSGNGTPTGPKQGDTDWSTFL